MEVKKTEKQRKQLLLIRVLFCYCLNRSNATLLSYSMMVFHNVDTTTECSAFKPRGQQVSDATTAISIL